MKKQNEVANVELTKAQVEIEKELSESETLNAYLANHAVEHYCAALGADVDEVETILSETAAADGANWLYTQPAIDGKKADGTPYPTQTEWEKANPAAVRVDKLAGKQWYKRAFVIGDARGVRTIVNGYNRYNEAIAGAEKKAENTLAACAALLGVSVETLKALQK